MKANNHQERGRRCARSQCTVEGSMAAVRVLVLACALLTAVASTPTLAQPVPYQVNPGDELKVDVWNEESLSTKVLVRPDGVISLPIAGEIDTRGLTPAAVADAIALALGEFMKDPPRVVVSVVEAGGNQIYVLGKVDKPGRFRIVTSTDVMQALALAGGLNSFADGDDIHILRRSADGSQVAIPFRYSLVRDGRDLDSNILLRSGDVVVVP